MPRLRTDDGPRKLRAVWLGPAGSTLPFQWTYVQWLVTLVAIPIGAAVGGLLLWLLGAGLVWTLGIGVLWGGAAGVWVAVKVMRHVTFDEPLRYLRRLVRGEFSRTFSTREELRPLEVGFTVPPVSYLSPAVCRSMDWDTLEQQPLDRHRSQTVNPYLTVLPASRRPRIPSSNGVDPLRPSKEVQSAEGHRR